MTFNPWAPQRFYDYTMTNDSMTTTMSQTTLWLHYDQQFYDYTMSQTTYFFYTINSFCLMIHWNSSQPPIENEVDISNEKYMIEQ